MPRRLCLACYNGQLLSHDGVEQRALSGIGLSHNGNVPCMRIGLYTCFTGSTVTGAHTDACIGSRLRMGMSMGAPALWLGLLSEKLSPLPFVSLEGPEGTLPCSCCALPDLWGLCRAHLIVNVLLAQLYRLQCLLQSFLALLDVRACCVERAELLWRCSPVSIEDRQCK